MWMLDLIWGKSMFLELFLYFLVKSWTVFLAGKVSALFLLRAFFVRITAIQRFHDGRTYTILVHVFQWACDVWRILQYTSIYLSQLHVLSFIIGVHTGPLFALRDPGLGRFRKRLKNRLPFVFLIHRVNNFDFLCLVWKGTFFTLNSFSWVWWVSDKSVTVQNYVQDDCVRS